MSELSLTLQGLNCPNCAGKIEKNVQKLKEVSGASLNLMKQEIFIEYKDDDATKEEIIDAVRKITVALEPHVKVEEKKGSKNQGAMPKQAAVHVNVGNIREGGSHGHTHTHDEGCGCGQDHDHSHDRKEKTAVETTAAQASSNAGSIFARMDRPMKLRLARYIAALAVYLTAILAPLSSPVTLGLFIVSYLLFGADVLMKAVKNIARGELFDENFLMSIATIGAFAIGDYAEAVAVMLFYQAGEFCQDLAVDHSRKSIQSLMDLQAPYANLVVGDSSRQVDPADVRIDDIILIKPGEKVPLDGIVIEGQTQIDASSLIGESIPRSARVGDDVMSGAVNLSGAIKIKVTKDYENSTVAKIMDMVENATNKKAPTERFITKFSKVYTPIVVLLAALLAVVPPLVIEGALFSDWLYRGLVFLVVSCPCALVISVPLSFFSGIGFASKKGVLVKGSTHLQALSTVDTVVFDKTGTLTQGVFQVTGLYPEAGVSEEALLGTAGVVENLSNHPIAKSILVKYEENFGADVFPAIADFEEIGGKGLKGMVNGEVVLAGNDKLMNQFHISAKVYDGPGTIVHVAKGGSYMGYIVISDVVKEDSKSAIARLKELGIKRIVMLTGDRKDTAEKIGAELGIDEVFADLLPNEKVDAMERIYQKNPQAKIAFAGDGINDAPVLARADVGLAMGGVGSDAAIEAADIVIMTDEPSKIAVAINTANKTMAIVKQNISFALGIKILVLILSAVGFASMWLAVFADVGVALLAVLNAMRVK